MLPKRYYRAKTDSLLIERLADDCLAICDPRARSIHSLNPIVSVVWEACAEGATLAEIAAALEKHFGKPAEDEVLRSAIGQLQSAKLITSDEPLAAPVLAMDRRALLRTFGAAVPAVLTFAGQLAAQPPTTTTGQPPTTPGLPTTTTTTAAPTTPRPTTTVAPSTTPKPTTTTRPTTPPRTTTRDRDHDHDHDHDHDDSVGHLLQPSSAGRKTLISRPLPTRRRS